MSPRKRLFAAALVVAAAGAAAALPSASAEPGETPAKAPTLSSALAEGTSGQGMVMGSRDPERPTRESSREALSAAAGSEVEPARSLQAREALGNIKELAASAEQAAKKLAKDAWQLPIGGDYTLTADFGQCSNLWSHCHTGLDFAAPSGTAVQAVASGTVSSTAWAGAYGNRTVLTHEDGTETWYCHQLQFGVKTGDSVFAGQEIGRVGSTGNSTGPHLHLEVRPGGGDAVDPAEALTFHGATP